MKNSDSRDSFRSVVLKEIEFAAAEHFSGHALSRLTAEELPGHLGRGIGYRVRTWVMSEELISPWANFNLFKEMAFRFSVKTSTPSSWWHMLKRDHAPKWFTKRWPVRYKDEAHKRKVSTWVRVDASFNSRVNVAYPKLPEIHSNCGGSVTICEKPKFSIKFCESSLPPTTNTYEQVFGHWKGEYALKVNENVVVRVNPES